MELFLDLPIKKPARQINYEQAIMLTGSCFTEHIGGSLSELKFKTLQNPHGILFDPVSVCNSLITYIRDHRYTENDLFLMNEVWQSWAHHGRFSGVDKQGTLDQINSSQQEAHEFIRSANWLIITLGSSYSYRLTNEAEPGGLKANEGVANCHRAPSQWFNKHLLSIDEIIAALDNCIHQLFHFNPHLEIIFTISPVRHIRDGVVENSRSKARLIEAVQHITGKFDKLHYFPAYELVIDVLRDYRFYDIDLVHPNYAATSFVFEKFAESYIDEKARKIMQELKSIGIARRHKPFHPTTDAHKKFMKNYYEKTKALQQDHKFLNLSEELNYFRSL